MATSDYQPKVNYDKSVTFTSGTTSDSVDLSGTTLVGLRIPASMAGSNLEFEMSDDGGTTFYSMRDIADSALTVAITTAARYYALDPADFSGVRHMRMTSDVSETSKTITLATRPVS